MTTEDDFQSSLDTNPADYQTRLVFADWLDERDDPRASGYRAMGMRQWRAYHSYDKMFSVSTYNIAHFDAHGLPDVSALPHDWFDYIEAMVDQKLVQRLSSGMAYIILPNRRQVEDLVATAFSYLPAYRREQLLNTVGAP